MRLAITGAAGGIGRFLARRLQASHEVTGIVRTMPGPERSVPNVRYVPSDGSAAFISALGEAEIVLHNAVDKKPRGRAFLEANHRLDETVLRHALAGKCRLFVYFSSMVVYSSTDPADADGYREDQTLGPTGRLDNYTRLKIEGEARVIEACTTAGVDYLILRPTIVTGPGLVWTALVYDILRRFPFGVRGALMNLVHVDDLCNQIERLIELGVRNEVFNLGTINVESEAFFTEVGRLVGRRPRYLSRQAMSRPGTLIPSSVWFFQKRVAINCDKVAAVTGFRSNRSTHEHFPSHPPEKGADIIEALRAVQLSGQPFKAHGSGYSYWFNRSPIAGRSVAISEHHGIVSLEDDRVTVRAGTRIYEVSEYLDRHDRTLATLPEFAGISAGACFFVDVHGSSLEHFSLYELIEEIKYLDPGGNVVVSHRNEAQWAELRRRDRDFILLEVTFRTEKSGYLSNRMEWVDDSHLEAFIASRHRENFSTTIQWFPHQKCMLVYNINRVEGPVAGAAPSVAPFRGLPFRLQQVLIGTKMRGRALQVDRFHNILSPWQKIPLEPLFGWLWKRPGSTLRDIELCVSIEDGLALATALRGAIASGEIAIAKGQGIGIRFSRAPRDNDIVAWIEFVTADPLVVERFLTLARRVCRDDVHYHRGKFAVA